MFDKIFSGTISSLQSGLRASELRGEVIQHNIANSETPGYKRQSVEFESLFRQAVNRQDSFMAKTTRDRHIQFGADGDVEARVVRLEDSTMRMDENNVDVEYENAELAKNQIYYNTITEKLNSELYRLRMAIREGS